MQHRILVRRLLSTFSIATLASTALAQTNLHTLPGVASDERFGLSAASAGDVNLDGKADFIAGGPEDANIFVPGQGLVRVYSGDGSGVLYTFNGATNGDGFGYSVGGAGDVNQDGYADVVIGARTAGAGGSNAGRVLVHSGKTGAVLHTFNGAANGDHLGASVAGAGDVNNDGYDDVIAGAPSHAAGGSSRGMARVYSGQSGGILHTITGTTNSANLGVSVDGVGDVNGDGFDDFVVGSLLSGARVYSGQTGAVLFTFTGAVDDRLGTAVAGAGRVDADLVPDVIVGAPQDGNTFSPGNGFARVYSGATGAVILTVNGVGIGDRFGVAVGGARDIDGDNRSELIVGADQFSIGGTGYVKVFSGNGGGLVYTFSGSSSNERFGATVDGLGDVNLDGNHEFIMGAPNRSTGGNSVNGIVQVWSEGAGCPSPVSYCTATLNSTNGAAAISSSGSTSIAANDFVLLVSGAPADKFGLFIYGVNQANVPFGNGIRCVGNPFFRMPSLFTDVNGEVVFNVNYNTLPVAGPITAGSTQNFQFWFRDPAAGGSNFNLSDGRSATFCP